METADQRVGVDIIRKALRTPCSTIVKNSGAEPADIMEKILASTSSTFGYDALKGIFVDMMEQGLCALCVCVCTVTACTSLCW